MLKKIYGIIVGGTYNECTWLLPHFCLLYHNNLCCFVSVSLLLVFKVLPGGVMLFDVQPRERSYGSPSLFGRHSHV